jgi:hypothetical protein
MTNIDPEKIKLLVQTDHVLTLAYAKERAFAKAHADAEMELEIARHMCGEAAKGVWLHVTVADKAAVLTELYPLYEATWRAFEEGSQ